MKYVVKYCGDHHEAARQMAEMRAARRELKAARCAIRSRV